MSTAPKKKSQQNRELGQQSGNKAPIWRQLPGKLPLKVKVEMEKRQISSQFLGLFWSKITPKQNNKPALRYICLSLPPINKTTLIHLHTGSRTAAGMSESCGGTTDAPDCAGENAGASTNLTNDNDLITSNYIALWINPTDLSQQFDMFKKCWSVSKQGDSGGVLRNLFKTFFWSPLKIPKKISGWKSVQAHLLEVQGPCSNTNIPHGWNPWP